MISSAAIASTITQVQVLSSSILANEANSLNLWPEEHTQRRAFRVDLGQPSGGIGGEPLRQQRAPGVLRLQGLSQNASPSRTSQTDLAPKPYIWLLIADCDGQGNGQAIGYPLPGWRACIPSNAAAYADALEMGAVCRQSISDSWLGNLREYLAHLV